MGLFVLIKSGPQAEGAIARATEAAIKRGFAAPTRRQVAGHDLLLAPKMVSPTPQLFEDAAGNFALAVGTLFYHGMFGAPALEQILTDAMGDGIDDAALRGSFALLTHLHGRLELVIDALGTYATYASVDDEIWSNSFLVAAAALPRRTLSSQGVYEYVFQGATYGGDTILRELRQLSPHRRYCVAPDRIDELRPIPLDLSPRKGDLSSQITLMRHVLNDNFAAIARAFGDKVDTALSGGYDSRLILALLRAHGVSPELHVYGVADDPDVKVAKTIAAGEKIALRHDDKSRHGRDEPAAIAEATEAQFWAFDGWPVDGVIGNGSDLATRRARAEGGKIALNGGGGEVFRNFFYLPNWEFTIDDMLATFYSQFDPKVTTPRFIERAYYEALNDKMMAIFIKRRQYLTRTEVEFVYPGFRGRFWTGRNTALNNHFGPALTPFFELNVVREAVRVPLGYKNHGVFEAALIAQIDPALARYPSVYGHSFQKAPPLIRRLKDWLTYIRPPALRRLSYRWQNRLRKPQPHKWLIGEHRAAYLPQGTPVMSEFFQVGAMTDSAQLNRLLTLEYLCRRLGI